MVILEVPAHHPPGVFPAGQAKLHDFHARHYSKDRAADLLLGLSLVFALRSSSMKSSDKTKFYQKCWFCCFSLRVHYLDLPRLTTALPCLLPCSLSHITSRACCLLVPFLTSPRELVALTFLAQQTGTPENYMTSATEGKELSDCQKFWKTLDRQTTPILYLVRTPKHMNSRVFLKKKKAFHIFLLAIKLRVY